MAGFGGWRGGVRTVFGGWGLDGMVDESEGRRGWGAWVGGAWVDEFTWNAGGAPDGGRSRVRARRGGRRERSAARREKRRGSGEWDGWFDRLSMNGERISLSEGSRRGGRSGSSAKQAEGIGDQVARLTRIVYTIWARVGSLEWLVATKCLERRVRGARRDRDRGERGLGWLVRRAGGCDVVSGD